MDPFRGTEVDNIRIRFVGGVKVEIKTRTERLLRERGHLLHTVGEWLDFVFEVCELQGSVQVTLLLDARLRRFIITVASE